MKLTLQHTLIVQVHDDLKTRALAVNDDAGEVVQHVINNLPEAIGATLPTMTNMIKTVHRARRAAGVMVHRPPPNTRHGWAFPEEMVSFPDGSRFLLHDSGENDRQRFIIMGSDRALEVLGMALHFFSDGMFRLVPVFSQLYSIHVDYVSHFHFYFFPSHMPNNYLT